MNMISEVDGAASNAVIEIDRYGLSMEMSKPLRAEPLVMARTGAGAEAASVTGKSVPFDWETIRETFRSGGHVFWLTTVSGRGVPHVVPVFAAWDGRERCFVATNWRRRSRSPLSSPPLVRRAIGSG